jgi:hypothetical protein
MMTVSGVSPQRVETGGWFSAPDQTLAVPPETGPAEGLFGVESGHAEGARLSFV